jgi:hypothetical protein
VAPRLDSILLFVMSFASKTPAIGHREDAKARVLRAENEEIRKRLDTLTMDQVLRNSDKGNLDLALSEMELGLFSAENRLTTRCHQGTAGLRASRPMRFAPTSPWSGTPECAAEGSKIRDR